MFWKIFQVMGFFLLMNQGNIIINGEEYSIWHFIGIVGLGIFAAITDRIIDV